VARDITRVPLGRTLLRLDSSAHTRNDQRCGHSNAGDTVTAQSMRIVCDKVARTVSGGRTRKSNLITTMYRKEKHHVSQFSCIHIKLTLNRTNSYLFLLSSQVVDCMTTINTVVFKCGIGYYQSSLRTFVKLTDPFVQYSSGSGDPTPSHCNSMPPLKEIVIRLANELVTLAAPLTVRLMSSFSTGEEIPDTL
jgi:hypothetical protein